MDFVTIRNDGTDGGDVLYGCGIAAAFRPLPRFGYRCV